MNGKLKFFEVKESDIPAAENYLLTVEKDYVSACARFLARDTIPADIWILGDSKKNIYGLLIKSRSTLLPVLPNKKDIPNINFLKKIIQKGKIHSIQGMPDEVFVLEKEINGMGCIIADIFNYDLMALDKPPDLKGFLSGPKNLVLRIPGLKDLEEIAPLQAAYEMEEVIPMGSKFNLQASKLNLANIIANGKIIAAELDGKIIGKINVSGVSFTKYQIGGVYVHPDFREKRIARLMTADFVSSLIDEGMGISLFVKKSNTAAQKLYTSMGFSVIGDYRITYY